jgi:Pregnancy-associated plasma protein-A
VQSSQSRYCRIDFSPNKSAEKFNSHIIILAVKKDRVARMKTMKVPPHRMCGTMIAHHLMLERDPGYRKRIMANEQLTRKSMMSPVERKGVTTIPVVVHVLFHEPGEKISKAQVKSQITVLNKDYRAKNPDRKKVPDCWEGLVTDSQTKFALATTDPRGKKTSGITYTKTEMTSFPIDDSMKSSDSGGMDPWPTDEYLNIWVCQLSDPAVGGTLLGYATFPGFPPDVDGVAILTQAFGTKGVVAAPFNLGRTTTHEVGHWLNLRHIWADTENCTGTDYVEDTPNSAGPNYGKPEFPHVTCNNGPNGDMFMNYMDYVDDDSMFMFTAQQVARMHATLDGPRKSIGTQK